MEKQLERIKQHYEAIYERLNTAVTEARIAVEKLEQLLPEAKELSDYYSGKTWIKDFSDDEADLIPDDIKKAYFPRTEYTTCLTNSNSLSK